MLIDQQYTNVFSLSGEVLKAFFNCRGLSLCINNQKVALRIWRIGDVADAGEKQARY